jgi:hypothetical protein
MKSARLVGQIRTDQSGLAVTKSIDSNFQVDLVNFVPEVQGR